MKHIQTEIIVDANIQKVWNTFMNFEKHSEWNPFIRKISGDPIIGNYLNVSLQQTGAKPMNFKPVILAVNEPNEFRWKGKLIVKGIFDGEHFFKLEKLNEYQTKFIQGEYFSGILVYFLGKMLENTVKGFEKMNEALKAECEK